MKNNIARVVLDLPVDEPFDYLIPGKIKDIKVGSRVLVPLREKRIIGYVAGFADHSAFKKLRPVLKLIDKFPLLDKELLDLAKELSSFYYCSLGEAIQTILPAALRKGRKIPISASFSVKNLPRRSASKQKSILINDPFNNTRWDIYAKYIKEALKLNKGVIFLSPELQLALDAAGRIKEQFKFEPIVLCRKQSQKKGFENWLNIINSKELVVVGTRSTVFAPVKNLGLIIIDEESNSSFKQEQSPFYHARSVALMRAKLSGARIILSSQSPSLESLYLIRKKQLKLIDTKKQAVYSNVLVVDMKEQFSIRRRKYPLISLALESRMHDVLNNKGRVILFHNRRGFARTMRCKKCGFKVTCPRCDVDLIHHYDKKSLSCPYCSYKHNLISLCPECRSSYIQFKSPGIEKLESELYRLFPNARIKTFEKNKIPDNFDILVTTQKILGYNLRYKVDLVGVISADMLWNRAEFSAQEQAFDVLLKLTSLSKDTCIIQTFFTENLCLKALKEKTPELFYKNELQERKRLKFPPFTHLVNIQTRGENEKLAESLSQRVSDKIKHSGLSKRLEILSCAEGSPKKLRGKFRFNILLKTKVIDKNFIKGLKNIIHRVSHPNVIISVDVDPL